MTDTPKFTPGEFAPCPFCSDERAFLEPDGDGIFHVECERCGCRGPVGPAEDVAIECWNRRVFAITPEGFSREDLQALALLSAFEVRPVVRLARLAAYALTLLDEKERAERERDEAYKEADYWRAASLPALERKGE